MAKRNRGRDRRPSNRSGGRRDDQSIPGVGDRTGPGAGPTSGSSTVDRTRSGHPVTTSRSRWRPGYWRRHPGFSLGLVLLYTLTFVAWAGAVLHTRTRLLEHGEQAVGTVVENESRRGGRMAVTFTTASGETVTASVDLPPERPRIGDQVTVLYDPAQPTPRAYRPGGEPGWGGILLLAGLGVVPGLIGSLYLYRTWGRWRDAAESWRLRRAAG